MVCVTVAVDVPFWKPPVISILALQVIFCFAAVLLYLCSTEQTSCSFVSPVADWATNWVRAEL